MASCFPAGASHAAVGKNGLKSIRLQNAPFIQELSCLGVVRPGDNVARLVVAIKKQRLGRSVPEDEIRPGNGRLGKAQFKKDLSKTAERNVVIFQGHAAVLPFEQGDGRDTARNVAWQQLA